MFRLRSEKVLFVVTVFFFILAWVLKGWIFVTLTAIVSLLGLSVTVISLMVEIRLSRGRIKLLTFCSLCKKILPIIPENQAPEYGPAPDFVEIPRDDMLKFEKEHEQHIRYLLEVIFGPWRRGPIGDPMTPGYLVARHKRNLFFVKRHRKSIMEPMSYELVEKGLPDFSWRWRFARLAFK